MSNPISFITANFVARELGYHMTQGWMEGDGATQAFFKPLSTFAERFDAMLGEAADLGFSAVDLWTAHLDPQWASDEHLLAAASVLERRRMSVISIAGFIPGDFTQLEGLARVAKTVGARILGGGCHPSLLKEKRAEFVTYLERHDLVFGYENHPEKSAAEVLAKIGGAEGGRIGVAADTGWFGTQKFNAAEALREIGSRLVHVHLKDIHEPVKGESPSLKDMGHETCALGEGVVPIQECLTVLRAIGYAGALGIEHEPEDHSPIEEVRVSLERVKSWI